MLSKLAASPEARLLFKAAKAAGLNPLRVLGIDHLPFTIDLALTILRLDDPAFGKSIQEDEEAHELEVRMQREEAWEAALPGGAGYDGPRGEGGVRHARQASQRRHQR